MQVRPVVQSLCYNLNMTHTKQKGDVSESQVLAHLIQQGYTVLIPFGENQRYDLVVEDEFNEFVRIQVKTGRIRNGSIRFATCSTDRHRRTRRGYKEDVDLFYVYCPDNDSIYRVPTNKVPEREASLRIDPLKNGRIKDIRWAKDFLELV